MMFGPRDIDAILFDLDGTLIESDNMQVRRWARRIKRFYRSEEAAQAAARRLVMKMETPTNTVFSLLDLVGLDRMAISLTTALQGSRREGDVQPMEGVCGLLKELTKRYWLGVVSTRSVRESEAFLGEMGVREAVGVVVGRDSTWRIKPHPQPVRQAAAELGVDPARCLMVGDTVVDIRAGQRAGAWTCGVLCGYGERRELERARADLIVEHTGQLGAYLQTDSAISSP